MRIEIVWEDEKTINNLCLRIEVLRLDRIPVGTAFAYDFHDGDEGSINKYEFSVDLSRLAPGRYTMNYTFFERNSFGGNIDVDCVHGLFFEIAGNSELQWNERAWGSVMLPGITAKECDNDEH